MTVMSQLVGLRRAALRRLCAEMEAISTEQREQKSPYLQDVCTEDVRVRPVKDGLMNATTTTPQQDRTADIVSAELATVKAERDEATGSKKGNLTKQVKKLAAELAALTPKPKKKAKGKFDSPAIVALITTASEPMTASLCSL